MPERFDDGDYILGTEDAELARLGLQHAVWRPRAADAWRRAGFSAGQHIVDVGCGPGYATFDLSDIVGHSGRVTAIDRSPRFLNHLARRLASEPGRSVDLVELDLDAGDMPSLGADAAWCRWVFAFLTKPRDLLRGVRRTLKPGAALVIHEYFDYGTWRLVPGDKDFDAFVEVVKTSWRASGGEPDIALDLLSWLPAEGFRVAEVRPIIDVVSPDNFIWQWPATFLETGVARLVELGHLTAGRGDVVKAAFRRTAENPEGRLITPGVLEILAVADGV